MLPLVGLHRLYVGKGGTGLLMLLTAGGFGVWWIFGVVMIASGSFRDADGWRVTGWAETNPEEVAGGAIRPGRS